MVLSLVRSLAFGLLLVACLTGCTKPVKGNGEGIQGDPELATLGAVVRAIRDTAALFVPGHRLSRMLCHALSFQDSSLEDKVLDGWKKDQVDQCSKVVETFVLAGTDKPWALANFTRYADDPGSLFEILPDSQVQFEGIDVPFAIPTSAGAKIQAAHDRVRDMSFAQLYVAVLHEFLHRFDPAAAGLASTAPTLTHHVAAGRFADAGVLIDFVAYAIYAIYLHKDVPEYLYAAMLYETMLGRKGTRAELTTAMSTIRQLGFAAGSAQVYNSLLDTSRDQEIDAWYHTLLQRPASAGEVEAAHTDWGRGASTNHGRMYALINVVASDTVFNTLSTGNYQTPDDSDLGLDRYFSPLILMALGRNGDTKPYIDWYRQMRAQGTSPLQCRVVVVGNLLTGQEPLTRTLQSFTQLYLGRDLAQAQLDDFIPRIQRSWYLPNQPALADQYFFDAVLSVFAESTELFIAVNPWKQ